MSTRKKPRNFIQRLFRAIWRFFNAITKAFISWLLRSLLLLQRRSQLSQAGFVLPTVIMVILVVILLTTAIMIRSFDRTKNASNYRVNEAVLNAAAPAIDRARAKLANLFSPNETQLKGNTPDETSIAQAFEKPRYTFGDEMPLKVVYNVDGQNGIDRGTPQVPSPEQLKTAWKFPIDTDNNGKFDSFTIYGIYYRTPSADEERARTPLEARARPQALGVNTECTTGAGDDDAGNVGDGWYSISGQLKKAFFTYVATVPITGDQYNSLRGTGYKDGAIAGTKFEAYKGNKGFSALEMQLDQARLALDNNAVWYEDDLVITDVPGDLEGFKLNGRVQVNGNLMVGSNFGNITFYQVSSPYSCYYNAENSKIVVGGNVISNGLAGAVDTSNTSNQKVTVHLFKGANQPFAPAGNTNGSPNSFKIDNDNNVTTAAAEPPREVAYNTAAYAKRLNALVTGAMELYEAATSNPPTPATVASFNRFPPEIKEKFAEKYPEDGSTVADDEARNLLQKVIEAYFKERIRRVPFAEVPIDRPERIPNNPNLIFRGGGELRPPLKWMRIEDPAGHNPNGYTNVELNFTGNTMKLAQTKPGDTLTEDNLGDRVLVGNGLPNVWLKDDGTYATPEEKEEGQLVFNGSQPINWNNKAEQRRRQGQADVLDDLGDTSRNGFWEKAAAAPDNVPGDGELAGGLRIITGAGIYVDDDRPASGVGTGFHKDQAPFSVQVRSFLPKPPVTPAQLSRINGEINRAPARLVSVVWPDTMPMYQPRPVGGPLKGDLQMRASVVYHYNNETDPDKPIACISSYYDPTNPTTAKNSPTVDSSPTGGAGGVSNNGLNYQPPTDRSINRVLRKQAYMVFPDGRWVNKPLKDAVEASSTSRPLSFEQKAAIDAAKCALGILDGTLGRLPTPASTPNRVPDGAIRERAFLDARQVKTVHKPDVEFDPNEITFQNTNPLINRQTFLGENPTVTTAQNVPIANPEQLKIATQATLKAPPPTKTFNPAPAEYSLPIEQRQPLEIRVTEIDLEQLRTTTFGTFKDTGRPEYLLPLSGIIYASRDDALPDISDVNLRPRRPRDDGGSATDFKLDPSRRPNGIRIWSSGDNGGRLSRGADNQDNPDEKGLILASNLPVYIKGDFNKHLLFGSNTEIEEFRPPLLDDDYNNFYNRRGRNGNFACRAGSRGSCPTGDQWRTARILSDAITLLSNGFRDGFRNEGDYDVNNNAGNLAVAARLKNGFWWNGFAPTYSYKDAGGTVVKYPVEADFPEQDALNPRAEIEGSSYAMNGVTPVQRRVDGFPEYQMEACPTLPVSECVPNGPNKWTTNRAGTTAPPTGAGDTLRTLGPRYANGNYARRVAFQRDPEYGQLVLASNTNPTPQPIGIRNGAATPMSYGGTVVPDNTTPNALWFWTTDNANTPPTLSNFDYNSNGLLYYLPDDPEIPTVAGTATERQMRLPGTPKFPPELETVNTAFAGRSVLNGNTEDDPSDYAVCINGSVSKDYKVSLSVGGTCPGPTLNLIQQMWQALNSLTANVPDALDPTVVKVRVTTPWNPTTTPTATATAKVNVFELDPALNNGITGTGSTPTIILDKGNQSDPIFVIRGAPTFRPVEFNNVILQLNGVDPNNVFWVARTGMRIRGTGSLAGNFIGGIGRLIIDDGSIIKGGRFLGFRRSGGGRSGEMTALTTTAQPLIVPVLQLHSPQGRPSDDAGTAFENSDNPAQRKWLQKAEDTEYYASLVMGDTPHRPYVTDTGTEGGENNGGLHNFPRFLENWAGRKATIRGSLIQYIKSKYATGPFDAVDLVDQDNSLFFDSPSAAAPPVYIQGGNPDVNPDPRLGYQYTEASARFKAPYYQPPIRNWGYDVALLSQTPDLFSRRFAIPSAGTPNEFFREASQDDPWIQTLLCAGEKQGGTTYTWAISDPNQRPNCPYALGDYSDP